MDVKVGTLLEMNEGVHPRARHQPREESRYESGRGHVPGYVLLRVVGPVLTPARGREVDVLLEDVAEDVRVDLVGVARRPRVEMPGEPVEEREDPLEKLVSDPNVVALLDRMGFEDAPVDIGDISQQPTDFRVGVVVYA